MPWLFLLELETYVSILDKELKELLEIMKKRISEKFRGPNRRLNIFRSGSALRERENQYNGKILFSK